MPLNFKKKQEAMSNFSFITNLKTKKYPSKFLYKQ